MVLKTLVEFVPSVHHPVVEVLKHTCSPLSAALYIFSIGKFNMHPSTRAYFRSRSILKNAPSESASSSTQAPASSDPSKRQFSTSHHFSAANRAFKSSSHYASSGLRFKNPSFSFGNRFASSGNNLRMLSSAGIVTAAASESTHSSASRFSEEKLQGIYDPQWIPEVLHHVQEFPSVKVAESLLYSLHDTTGLPWWATIVAFTLALRSFTTTFNVLLLRNTLRMKVIRSDIEALDQKMTSSKTSEAEKVAAARKLQDLLRDKGCHPLNNWIIPFLFPPLILSVFGAMHNLCLAEPQFATDGALWFTNMMDVDHSYILYVASSLTWLWNVEIAGGSLYLKDGRVRMVTRVVALASIPVVATMPCGVMLFWITSNLWEITRVHVLRNEKIRKALGIPLESELPKMVIGYW